MEVLYIDIFVGGGLALAPQQQALFGCHLLHRNVLDGESQDDGPDHAEGHLQVAVDDFFGADGHQLDALPFDELEGFVDVGDLRGRDLVRGARGRVTFNLPCGNASCRDRALGGSPQK